MADHKRVPNIKVENAKIVFKNFSGKESRYNRNGSRNFCVLIDNALGEVIKRDGWNVRYLRPRDDGDAPQAYLPVTVRYDRYPPKIVEHTSTTETEINEDDVSRLDWQYININEMTITPSFWQDDDGTWKIKAYLGSMDYNLVEDDYRNRYYDIPDSADLYE